MTQCHNTFQFDKYCLQPSLLRENKQYTSYMHTVYHILYNTFTKQTKNTEMLTDISPLMNDTWIYENIETKTRTHYALGTINYRVAMGGGNYYTSITLNDVERMVHENTSQTSDVSNTSRSADVTVKIMRETRANFTACRFQFLLRTFL